MSGSYAVFFILGLLTIGGAIFMINFNRVVHMVISIGVTFISIAGLFVLLGAEFVAVSQILVYSGAISILMLFGIMLTKHNATEEGKKRRARFWFSLAGVMTLFTTIFMAIQNTNWSSVPARTPNPSVSNVKEIGIEVFTKFVIPFELLSVLLLVALVGAIVLAKKEEE
ncbi:NADH-quinone oxidoreductase subunit J [Brevibacillus laterosporus]|uniref:NADH-quinone oxidoreductase subunit J n=1 Tax=Brevibacillus laterosporus TaxID=1465 RepID=UPI00240510F7|nr:NADH-quinone oxidoreductase subunit J [Brevibacillus laterosporus]